jgi:hypothetical protein
MLVALWVFNHQFRDQADAAYYDRSLLALCVPLITTYRRPVVDWR